MFINSSDVIYLQRRAVLNAERSLAPGLTLIDSTSRMLFGRLSIDVGFPFVALPSWLSLRRHFVMGWLLDHGDWSNEVLLKENPMRFVLAPIQCEMRCYNSCETNCVSGHLCFLRTLRTHF